MSESNNSSNSLYAPQLFEGQTFQVLSPTISIGNASPASSVSIYGNIYLPALQNSVTLDVVYYDTSTLQLSYGSSGAVANAWLLTGNSSVTGYLGTSDSSVLSMRTNGSQFLSVDSTQNLTFTGGNFVVNNPTFTVNTGISTVIKTAGNLLEIANTNATGLVEINSYNLAIYSMQQGNIGSSNGSFEVSADTGLTLLSGAGIVLVPGLAAAVTTTSLYYNTGTGAITQGASALAQCWTLTGTNTGGSGNFLLGTSDSEGWGMVSAGSKFFAVDSSRDVTFTTVNFTNNSSNTVSVTAVNGIAMTTSSGGISVSSRGALTLDAFGQIGIGATSSSVNISGFGINISSQVSVGGAINITGSNQPITVSNTNGNIVFTLNGTSNLVLNNLHVVTGVIGPYAFAPPPPYYMLVWDTSTGSVGVFNPI